MSEGAISIISIEQLVKCMSNTTIKDALLEMGLPGGVTVEKVSFDKLHIELDLSNGQFFELDFTRGSIG